MPSWYEKYNNLLNRAKKISRANSIHLWHEKTLARMRARLMNLEVQKIRTRMSAKHII
jgi:hypothetical protein